MGSYNRGVAADSPCPFCAIVSGEADADVVLDDDGAVAFLDRSPLFKGHVLVVPRDHVVTLPELADVEPFFIAVQRLLRRCRRRWTRRARSSRSTTSSARACRTSMLTSCRGHGVTACAASSGRAEVRAGRVGVGRRIRKELF